MPADGVTNRSTLRLRAGSPLPELDGSPLELGHAGYAVARWGTAPESRSRSADHTPLPGRRAGHGTVSPVTQTVPAVPRQSPWIRRASQRLLRPVQSRLEVARWRAEAQDAPALPPWAGPATTRPPIFVGGTGRSGTTITAKVLAAHPDYALIPYEVHFITDAGGLCDLVCGRTTIGRFERRFVARWFVRHTGNGLHRFAPRPLVAVALQELRLTYPRDGAIAAQRFVHRLFDPVAAAAGAEGWIEMTPNNVEVADALVRIFPTALIAHSVRDGRDVASSVVSMRWGPSDHIDAVEWWGRRLEKAFAASSGLPPAQSITVQLEELTTHARERELARYLAWAGLEEHPQVRAFFEREVSAERSHSGRWGREIPPDRLEEFEAVYDGIARGLRERRRPYAPPIATVESSGTSQAQP